MRLERRGRGNDLLEPLTWRRTGRTEAHLGERGRVRWRVVPARAGGNRDRGDERAGHLLADGREVAMHGVIAHRENDVINAAVHAVGDASGFRQWQIENGEAPRR